ncbi:Imm59 family immunity protein [Streptococcus sp. IMAU11622]|uniref:Imm59 family immunity protein n=1 Tax=Streptococcus sp. IMAU11622 TaxID=3332597 RepID=UPI0035F3611E
MRDEAQECLELLSAIQDLGYESLRYSIFNEYGPGEWEVVIEFDDSKQLYNVYATMDRASYNKKLEFDNFEAAKNKFLEKLDLTVEINKLFVENGEVPEYSSPLWDKSEIDIESLKNIVEKEIKERGLESLYYVLFDEDSRKPWATHLFFKNGKFQINSRDERSYIVGKTLEFNTMKEAKDEFFKILSQTVHAEQLANELGFSHPYPSPLWDEEGK